MEILDKSKPLSEEEYEEKMIEAFVQKPEKFDYYKRAFKKFNVNGIERIAWHWSWWGFFFEFWFLLYRKAYIGALISFLGGILLGLIPFFGPLIWMILNGGYDVYFIYKKYKKLKNEIEMKVSDPYQRIETMYILAKPNTWVIWVVAIISILSLLGFFAVVISGSYNDYNY